LFHAAKLILSLTNSDFIKASKHVATWKNGGHWWSSYVQLHMLQSIYLNILNALDASVMSVSVGRD
jgi:hypothetical protein